MSSQELDLWVLAGIGAVLILGSARLTRLVTHDDFPPVAWLRARWDAATGDSGWNTLLHCPFCLAPWVVAAVGAWGYLTSWHWHWWLLFGWLGVSYLASMVVAWDEPPD